MMLDTMDAPPRPPETARLTGRFKRPDDESNPLSLDQIFAGPRDRSPAPGEGQEDREFTAHFPGGDRFHEVALDVLPREFQPRFPLDLPVDVDIFDHWQITGEELFGREDVLEEVVRLNRELLPWSIPTNGVTWYAVVEVGDKIEYPTSAFFHVECGGLGYQEHTVYRPVRLVRPTPDEVERYT